MRILIAGAAGMLGQDLQKALAGRDVTALSRADLDVTDRDAVLAAAAGHDVIVNASAYTKVDDAETHEDDAYAINALGTENLAVAAARNGARFVTVSTDYVFDGHATEPYAEDTPRDPINAYGRTKAAGEELALAAHPDGTFVVRTAWLYGAGGPNFAKTMVKLAGSHETVSVVDDQLGQPTWTGDLAAQIVALLDSDAPAGVYHGTNSGQTSWYGFARAVFAQAGLDPERVKPTDSSTFVRPAPRPSYSVLAHDGWARAGLAPLRPWEDALAAATAEGLFAE
ncbi:dTDP-4-dehydrorhamnose reductase [Leifsonia sp. 98AMF]|uniref:dTDP-4-dehydrorhamnose reductase n=1 Tax=unclassified Leifsonia TaxID=2663824 RepID=UPI00087C1FCA|nr:MULTISPECIES: dTDP-4-dehydrorhamnose reductase [unclassified Leifsonia]SDH18476.1 dTDP-4-dehydrorhamnose reductase [Leifsonia sp. 197AMF]SDJ20042.1 dTDP-4-dehydrorhamnose reductase [Leifsonia sp. 466MF]SDJ45770.1 dTDP-4-dehydrorhamnose reductase [Leifsonia sp. 157MF]SDN41453.1 dTDP-4-dehydrorhamnose reductase [Leifsonia sp. 509MF]SEM78942.1 dTDP-4-dehydrorhamnose reductase [Leifsonia sp. 467MF]